MSRQLMNFTLQNCHSTLDPRTLATQKDTIVMFPQLNYHYQLSMDLENDPSNWHIFSYSGGPTQLPRWVMKQLNESFLNFQNTRLSILEMSSNSHEFQQVLQSALDNLRYLYDIPAGFKTFFSSGGGTLLFDAIPMNLLKGKQKATYAKTGYWSQRAVNEALILCPEVEIAVEIERDEKLGCFVQPLEHWKVSADTAYLHYCDNETVEGLEYQFIPKIPGLPLVTDMSSNFLTKVIDWSKIDLVYAHAQKNIGIAGSALMVINEKLIDDRKLPTTPYMCDFEEMLRQQSQINTLPVLPIYVNSLVFQWMREQGKVADWEMRMGNRAKRVYDVIEASHGVFRCSVRKDWRSRINVSFTLRDQETTDRFIQFCEERGLVELRGHRSVGGCRASLYVPVPEIAIGRLCDVMEQFANN